MVVYFNMLGWREYSSGAVPHVAGQELSIVTTSVKTSLTRVRELSALSPASSVLDTGYQW